MRSRERFTFCIIGLDHIAETRQIKDMAIVLAQPVTEEALLLTVQAHQQGDEQTDPATIHVR